MNNELMFSSKTDLWATPQAFFDKLHKVFRFEVDVCALPENAKCGSYYSPDDNGLAQEWRGTCWMNPLPCNCGVHPNVLYLEHENENLPKMLEEIAAHQRLLVVENGKRKTIRILMVQGMQQRFSKKTPSEQKGRPGEKTASIGREAEIQQEQKRHGIQADQERDRQPQKAAETTDRPIFMGRESLEGLPGKMGSQVRILWSGDDISTGSFYSVIASRMPGNNSEQHDPVMLYMQFEEGVASSKRMVGFCAICPNCGKAGIAETRPITAFMNPPYGREIAAWVEKAYRSAKENGATVVCLLPARVDTRWWHDYCAKGEVFFVRGRLKFGGSENSAPFPNAVVVFRPSVHDALAEAV